MVEIFVRLQLPTTRQHGLKALAEYMRCKEAHLFGKDAELGIFLPARGLPQTFRCAARWHEIFDQCEPGTCASALLPLPESGEQIRSAVVTDKLGLSILVLLGAEPDPSVVTQIHLLLPLIGAKLTDERAAESAAGHAATAREAGRQARSLNLALDANRRALQQALEQLENELAVRREAERKLREADRKKDEFLAMLAHELRNPLAPISMATQLIKLPSSDRRQIERASQILDRQVTHMTSLLDDLLDVSRVTRGRIELEKEAVDIKMVIADAIEQCKSLVQVKQQQLNVHLSGETAYVQGDKTRLVQIVANILINAAKYTPSEGTIDLRLEVSRAEVLLDVSDNGIGIESDLMPHIFELFTQAPRTPDRSQGGLGIGLALVKSLVQLHGGSVTAQSRGPNMGSQFSVRLPRYIQPLPSSAPREEDQATVPESQLAILVVDDNVDAADSLATLMNSLGHRVQTGYTAKQAAGLTADNFFDVVFLDIGLPDLNGYQLAKEIRKSSQCAGAVLVALTGYGQPQDRQLARDAGFDVHLTKPADFPTIMRVLDDAAASRHGSSTMIREDV